MKLCMVFNPRDSKLRNEGAYCSIFKDMFHALIDRFDCRQFITNDCSAKDIDADLIFFFDPHASHHIKIEDVDKHPAIKMEYWNDCHQEEVRAVYKTTNEKVHKLGRRQRVERFRERGAKYIVSPVKYFFLETFFQYFGPDVVNVLLHFPHAPNLDHFETKQYLEREGSILGNGATWGGSMNGYDFRTWAFTQPYITHIKHWVQDKSIPMGENFLGFLSNYMGALALCTPIPVPKYIEVPAAGCVTFAEYHKEYEDLGFKDLESCVYVSMADMRKKCTDFLMNPKSYNAIAEAGRKLVEENYTAKHFADFIYNTMQKEKEEKPKPIN